MRLVTHNMLVCNVRACVDTAARGAEKPLNFPLKIQLAPGVEAIKQVESEFNPEFIARLIPKLDWDALRQTAADLGIAALPAAVPAHPEEDEAFLKSVHDLTMDIHVLEGALVCPHCSRQYPVRKGIPNMLLAEDEV